MNRRLLFMSASGVVSGRSRLTDKERIDMNTETIRSLIDILKDLNARVIALEVVVGKA